MRKRVEDLRGGSPTGPIDEYTLDPLTPEERNSVGNRQAVLLFLLLLVLFAASAIAYVKYSAPRPPAAANSR